MEQQTKNNRRRLQGVIVKDSMDKSVVVRVDRVKLHQKHQKRFTTSKRYTAHDEQNACHVGDMVTIEETRPISKTKKWRVVAKITVS